MLLRVSFRQIEIADIGGDCRFFPEEGEYERHLEHAREDIGTIVGVTSAQAPGNNQIIVSVDGMDLEGFKVALKPILQDHFQALRISLPIEVIS
jgi:hypothetical protein